jgi:histidinol-phosphatase
VTEADRGVEEMIRSALAELRPDDAVLGEEYGTSGDGDRRWVIDPIDGTKNFVRGVPAWATLIGVEVGGTVDVGVVSAPALGRRWWARRGSGAFANGDPIRVSGVSTIADAHVGYDDIPVMEEYGLAERFLELARRCWRSRGFGDFWTHVLVAEGALDIAVEPIVAPWDLGPLPVILEEAGGRFTDLSGNVRIDGGNALSTNGLLHDLALEALRA